MPLAEATSLNSSAAFLRPEAVPYSAQHKAQHHRHPDSPKQCHSEAQRPSAWKKSNIKRVDWVHAFTTPMFLSSFTRKTTPELPNQSSKTQMPLLSHCPRHAGPMHPARVKGTSKLQHCTWSRTSPDVTGLVCTCADPQSITQPLDLPGDLSPTSSLGRELDDPPQELVRSGAFPRPGSTTEPRDTPRKGHPAQPG